MKRAFAMLVLAAGLLIAACGGPGGSAGTSLEPFSPDTSPSVESPAASESTEMMSPEASPS
jgi:ABC-type glycerol-3-phosphate transport system substrate-binding protein